MPSVRIETSTVHGETPYWRDKFDVVHLVRTGNRNYTMCHVWVHVHINNGVQVMGYTEDTPNCLRCMIIEQ